MDVIEELQMVGVKVVEWWELVGMESEGQVYGLRRSVVVGADGVHLSDMMNRSAAVNLCRRLSELELSRGGSGVGSGGIGVKRGRMES